MSASSRVYIETGNKRAFACSLEWPGLARSGKTEDAALAALASYVPRYAPRGGARQDQLRPIRWPAVACRSNACLHARGERTSGCRRRCSDPTTATSALTKHLGRRHCCPRAGRSSTPSRQAHRRSCARAPRRRPGQGRHGRPRCGSRADVRAQGGPEATRAGPRRPRRRGREQDRDLGMVPVWEVALRGRAPWPPRYAARRLIWHVLDHAWEIEDRRQ